MSNPNQVVVSQVSDVTTVELTTTGPQGPSFAVSQTTMDDSGKVNNSVVYFDSTSGTFKADATRTVENLVDGGNF
jgi:hypothetical protein|tara:strand:+ start:204 stop:428 length:225 start_codon:yes stop_codon:yes gene_type:complete